MDGSKRQGVEMELQRHNAEADYITVFIRRDVLKVVSQTFAVVQQEELGEEPHRLVQPAIVETGNVCSSCGEECAVLVIDAMTMPARIQCEDCSMFRPGAPKR